MATTEVTLSSRTSVRLTVIRALDRAHDIFKVVSHLGMLLKDMIPGDRVKLDETTVGIAYLRDDRTLRHAWNVRHGPARSL